MISLEEATAACGGNESYGAAWLRARDTNDDGLVSGEQSERASLHYIDIVSYLQAERLEFAVDSRCDFPMHNRCSAIDSLLGLLAALLDWSSDSLPGGAALDCHSHTVAVAVRFCTVEEFIAFQKQHAVRLDHATLCHQVALVCLDPGVSELAHAEDLLGDCVKLRGEILGADYPETVSAAEALRRCKLL